MMQRLYFLFFFAGLFATGVLAKTPVTACGTLSSAGRIYQLQNDVTSTGTCFMLGASNITLDLNGHTVTYDTGASNSVYGITVSSTGFIQNIHITSSQTGGSVLQSTACKINLATQASAGLCTTAHPINIGGNGSEVDHLTIVDYGPDNQAITMASGTNESVHDNTICPYHTKSALNHYAIFGEIALNGAKGVVRVNNNTIGTACMNVTGQPNGFGYTGIYIPNPSSIRGTLEVTRNSISLASPVRDGYAIEFGCANKTNIGFEVAYNTINQVSGRGIIVAGWNSPTSPGCGLGTIHDNNVTVKEAGNEGYGAGDAIGIQVRFGGHDIQVYNNTVTLNIGSGACPAQFYTDLSSDCGGIGIN